MHLGSLKQDNCGGTVVFVSDELELQILMKQEHSLPRFSAAFHPSSPYIPLVVPCVAYALR
jgi:hypothetical protein